MDSGRVIGEGKSELGHEKQVGNDQKEQERAL